MKITILGGTGWLGAEILAEAVERGHDVCVISRNPEDIKYTLNADALSIKGDASNYEELLTAIPIDTEVLVNSLIPDPFVPSSFTELCENIIKAAKVKKVDRLVAVGDACVFKVTDDKLLADTTFLTPFYRDWFRVHEKTHEMYLALTDLEWIEISPAAKCLPDKKLKEYLIVEDALASIDPVLTNHKVEDPDHFHFADVSYISIQDYAVAVLDEIEQKKYSKTRISVAWKRPHEMYWEGNK